MWAHRPQPSKETIAKHRTVSTPSIGGRCMRRFRRSLASPIMPILGGETCRAGGGFVDGSCASFVSRPIAAKSGRS